jgi:hypothetical protein
MVKRGQRVGYGGEKGVQMILARHKTEGQTVAPTSFSLDLSFFWPTSDPLISLSEGKILRRPMSTGPTSSSLIDTGAFESDNETGWHPGTGCEL